MSRQWQAMVRANHQLTPWVWRLELEGAGPGAEPGQFVMLRAWEGLELLLPRPMSVHWAEQGRMKVLYRVVGRGTKALSLLKPGEKVWGWGPAGKGFTIGPGRVLAVAGGMGIAPVAFAVARLVEAGAEVVVVHGAATAQYSAEALGCAEMLRGAKVLQATDDGSAGLKATAVEAAREWLEWCERVIACGPPGMARALAEEAGRAGVDLEIAMEAVMACGAGLCMGCAVPRAGGGYIKLCTQGPVVAGNQVDWERLL